MPTWGTVYSGRMLSGSVIGQRPAGPASGKRNFQGRDKEAETALEIQGRRAGRERGCTPHISQNDTNRRSAIDARTTRHHGDRFPTALACRAALCAVVMAVLSIGKSSIITSNEHMAALADGRGSQQVIYWGNVQLAKVRQTSRMALPLSLRKSAMVLKSGANWPVSQTSSILRWHSRSSRRLDGTRLR